MKVLPDQADVSGSTEPCSPQGPESMRWSPIAVLPLWQVHFTAAGRDLDHFLDRIDGMKPHANMVLEIG